MAFSLIASANSSANEGLTSCNTPTTGKTTTGADLIVVSVVWYNGAGITPTPLDSKSNTLTGTTVRTNGVYSLRIFYVSNPTVGSNHYIESPNLGQVHAPSICWTAWSGSFTSGSPLDQQNGATASSSQTINSGSITPTEANELVVSAVLCAENSSAETFTNSSGFTVDEHVPGVSGQTVGSAFARLVQGSASAVSCAWDAAVSVPFLVSSIVSFKGPGGGGGGGTRPVGWPATGVDSPGKAEGLLDELHR